MSEDKRLRVKLEAVDEHGEAVALGTWMGKVRDEDAARAAALAELWDPRLDAASCSPRYDVSAMPRYVHGDWNHIFAGGGPGGTQRDLRFVYDHERETVTHLEIARATGYVPSDAAEREDVADSLKNANAEALTDPESWGLEASDALPDWAQERAPRPVSR